MPRALLIENPEAQVKVEFNVVFWGTALPVERHPLSPKTADLFSVALDLPVLAPGLPAIRLVCMVARSWVIAGRSYFRARTEDRPGSTNCLKKIAGIITRSAACC